MPPSTTKLATLPTSRPSAVIARLVTSGDVLALATWTSNKSFGGQALLRVGHPNERNRGHSVGQLSRGCEQTQTGAPCSSLAMRRWLSSVVARRTSPNDCSRNLRGKPMATMVSAVAEGGPQYQ